MGNRVYKGLCSDNLCITQSHFCGGNLEGTFKIKIEPNTQYLLFSMGTGIAPFLWILEEISKK